MKILRYAMMPLLLLFIFFATLFSALLIYERYALYQEYVRRKGVVLLKGWEDGIDFVGANSAVVAVDWAHNAEFAQALAERDRERLYRLAEPVYRALASEVKIRQAQFYIPIATSFLRMHAPGTYGDDLSQFRSMVVDANKYHEVVTGLEVGRSGLGVRTVAPIDYEGSHVGLVEIGIGIDEDFLARLQDITESDWVVSLLPTYAMRADLGNVDVAAANEGSIVVVASTLEHPFQIDPETYHRLLTYGEPVVVTHITQNGRHYAAFTFPLKDYSGRTIGFIGAFYDETPLLREREQYLGLYLFLFTTAIVVGGWLLYTFLEQALSPLLPLTQAVEAIAGGDLETSIPVISRDEVGELARGIEKMRQRLKALLEQMGRRIEERTAALTRRSRMLFVAAELVRIALSINDPEQLLDTMATKITEALGFYHVGIFLRDTRGEYMVLQAASSKGGQQMLAKGHRLRIGEVGIVGYVASTGNPRVAQATGEDIDFFDNPYLPETRAEMALPLRVENEIIGVLDVQAKEENAFEESDILIMQTLADQMALALANIRLLREAQDRLREINRLLVERSLSSWRELMREQRVHRYLFDGVRVQPVASADQAARAMADSVNTVMRFPLEPRPGEIIGSLQLGWASKPSPSEVEIVRTVAERVATALEGARLFSESQELLVEAELLYRLQRRIAAARTPQALLMVFVEDLFHSEIDRCILMQDVGEGKGRFVALWKRNENDPFQVSMGSEITLPSVIVAQQEGSLFLDNLRNAPISEADRAIFTRAQVESIAIVPLVASGERWGWLFVETVGRSYTFLEREKRLLRILSEAAAVTLQNIVLVESAQRRALREQQAFEIADEMQRAADIEVMLKQVIRSLRTTLGASYVSIHLGEGSEAWRAEDEEEAV